MRDTIFLIFDGNGIKDYRKSVPKLSAGQYAVELRLSVPNRFFERAFPVVSVELPDSYAVEPVVDVVPIEPALYVEQGGREDEQ